MAGRLVNRASAKGMVTGSGIRGPGSIPGTRKGLKTKEVTVFAPQTVKPARPSRASNFKNENATC